MKLDASFINNDARIPMLANECTPSGRTENPNRSRENMKTVQSWIAITCCCR